MKELQVKLLSENAIIPTRSHEQDGGLDMYSTQDRLISGRSSEEFDFGVAVDIPEGYVGLLFARSGLGSRGIRPSNCVGVIDSGYRGSIKVTLRNDTVSGKRIKVGDRVAQLVIVPIVTPNPVVVDDFQEKTSRGEGGFGSSGR